MNGISASNNNASMAARGDGISGGTSVTVQRGDTMSAIAAKHNVPLQAMIDANPQIANPDKIYPGNVLTVPSDVGNEAQGGQERTPVAADERGAGDALHSPFAQNGERFRSQVQKQDPAAVPVPAEKPSVVIIDRAADESDKNLDTVDVKGTEGFGFTPDVQNAIATAAQKYGVSAHAMSVIAKIESRGDPAAKNPNSTAGGLFQQTDRNAGDYGVEDRYDPHQSANGAARFMRENQRQLRQILGREPTVGELYLAHQQGAGGARALLSRPNDLAVDVLNDLARATGSSRNGREKVLLNGGDVNMKAREFANLWINKAQSISNAAR